MFGITKTVALLKIKCFSHGIFNICSSFLNAKNFQENGKNVIVSFRTLAASQYYSSNQLAISCSSSAGIKL